MSTAAHRRMPRLFVAMAIVSALFGSTAASPLYGLYQTRWGFASITLTALFAVYAVGVLVSLFSLGRLADRVKDAGVFHYVPTTLSTLTAPAGSPARVAFGKRGLSTTPFQPVFPR